MRLRVYGEMRKLPWRGDSVRRSGLGILKRSSSVCCTIRLKLLPAFMLAVVVSMSAIWWVLALFPVKHHMQRKSHEPVPSAFAAPSPSARRARGAPPVPVARSAMTALEPAGLLGLLCRLRWCSGVVVRVVARRCVRASRSRGCRLCLRRGRLTWFFCMGAEWPLGDALDMMSSGYLFTFPRVRYRERRGRGVQLDVRKKDTPIFNLRVELPIGT